MARIKITCSGGSSRFLKGVKGPGGEHMDFVDDVNFIFSLGRWIFHFFTDITDVIDTVIGSGIDFYDIDAAAFLHGRT